MKTLFIILACILILPFSAESQETMDVNIGNPRVDADSFKFEVQIRRTNDWSTTILEGIGNCDFYFDYNDLAFTGNPFLADTNVNITNRPLNYGIQVGIIGDQFRVRLDFTLVNLDFWNPPLNLYEDLCTVAWEIDNPAENSGVTWDQINSGFNDVEGDIITPTYFGNGDISLPVELATFTASMVNEGVELKWVTESEIENAGFEVWRSDTEAGGYAILSTYQYNTSLLGQGNSNTRYEYSYRDEQIVQGQTYWYKLVDVALNGERGEHGPVHIDVLLSDDRLTSVSSDIPSDFKLHQNYPNPFNPSTRIRFDIPRISEGQLEVNLVIYNSLGQVTRRLYSGEIGAGSFEVEWDGLGDSGNRLPSGIYFATFATNNYYQTIRLVLLK